MRHVREVLTCLRAVLIDGAEISVKKHTTVARALQDPARGVFRVRQREAVLRLRRFDSQVPGDRRNVGTCHVHDGMPAAVGARRAVDFLCHRARHRLQFFDAVVVRRKVAAEVYILRLLYGAEPADLHQVGGKHD